MNELIGGVPVRVLQEIADAVGGRIVNNSPDFGNVLVFGRGRSQIMIPLTRLGVTTTPDGLGTITANSRPGGLPNALRMLDATQQRVRLEGK